MILVIKKIDGQMEPGKLNDKGFYFMAFIFPYIKCFS